MDDWSKSSQSDASANDAQPKNAAQPKNTPSLEAGLAALKRRDYVRAIALLQSVVQTATDNPTVTKAQMSLVMAFERNGNVAQAIALSKQLSKSSTRQVKLWALRMVDELNQRQVVEPDIPQVTPVEPPVESSDLDVEFSEDATGFVPLDTTTRMQIPPAQRIHAVDDEVDNTVGFVPFSESAVGADPDAAEAAKREVTQSPLAETPLTPAESFPVQPGDVDFRAAQSISPLPPSDTSDTPTPPPAAEWTWRQAGRSLKWGSLGSVDLATLWAVEVATVVALVLVVGALVQGAIALFNNGLVQLRWIVDLRRLTIFADPFWFVVLGLVALFLTSPWLMDGILKLSYRVKPLSLEELAASSPESVRVLKRVCNQRHYPLPSLRLLPVAVPIALTYGFIPQNARIVVSRGLLQQLDDGEIATILMGELGHVTHWDFGVISWVALVAQLPYQGYESVSTWGNRRQAGLKAIAVGVSAACYGLFWLLRWTGLWLSRLRVEYSDRTASEMTGNPNALTRALLKITIGIAADIQRQGYTSTLLQSLDLLTPVGYQTALTLGSTYPYSSFEELLMWDRVNPHRHWLALNNSHPPMGDRLHRLASYARHWRLETELNFDASTTLGRRALGAGNALLGNRFWLQSAPFLGIFLGLLIASGFWLIGAIAAQAGWLELIWMLGDQSILWGCLLTGFSIGSILRINTFFPDIRPSTLQVEPALPDLLTVPQALPIDSQPIRLHGTLLGRSGVGNILAQDLFLCSQTGLIKLHHVPLLGPIGHLLPQSRPTHLINSPVTITGWFRRGATPWIDVDTIQPRRGFNLKAAHPLWSTLLAFTSGILGALIIFRGGA